MNTIWKLIFVVLLTVGGATFSSLSTQASEKPYEFTFEKDASSDHTFNNISINTLKITLDKPITADESDIFDPDATSNPIYVTEDRKRDPVNLIKDVKVDRNELTVFFKNVELTDYTEVFDYKLHIEEESLYFNQLESIEVPFKIYDILPGFKSTFIDSSSSTINNQVFKTNAPRDVLVHVPKTFIRAIETIHHYEGIVPEEDQATPTLTNIDIIAEREATQLKVEFGNNSAHSRDLKRRTDVDGFTMGQAGINEITENQTESFNEFELKAYNDEGKFLEQKKFKLRIKDPKENYRVSDYLPEPTSEFGQTYSLYDLMADPKLLETIITRIPVSQLDSLGVTYEVSKETVGVCTNQQLNMALDNSKVNTIELTCDINLENSLVIDRSITLEGSHKLQGDVVLGTGRNIEVHVSDLTVTGDLAIDVGVSGTVALNNVTVEGSTSIISGGENSIHLNNFGSDNGIEIKNTSPLRVVNNKSETPIKIADNSAPVTLEGDYQTVTVDSTEELKTTENTTIEEVVAEGDSSVILKGNGTIESSHGQVDYPSGLTIEDVSAEAYADPENDVVKIVFNKDLKEEDILTEKLLVQNLSEDPLDIDSSGQSGNTITIQLKDDVKIEDSLIVGLKSNETLYDNEDNGSITGATRTATVTSEDSNFAEPTAEINGEEIILTFEGDLDITTVKDDGSDFKIVEEGYSVSDVNKDEDPKMVLTLTEAPPSGEVVTITLSSDNQITDEVGNTLDSEIELTVSNK